MTLQFYAPLPIPRSHRSLLILSPKSQPSHNAVRCGGGAALAWATFLPLRSP